MGIVGMVSAQARDGGFEGRDSAQVLFDARLHKSAIFRRGSLSGNPKSGCTGAMSGDDALENRDVARSRHCTVEAKTFRLAEPDGKSLRAAFEAALAGCRWH